MLLKKLFSVFLGIVVNAQHNNGLISSGAFRRLPNGKLESLRVDTASCADLSHSGIDYEDSNITVLPGNNPDECCKVCGDWNLNNATSKDTTCNISVWHNVPSPAQKVCALKATHDKPVKGHLVLALLAPSRPSQNTFRFSSVYTDQMVLQAAPQQAQVWGFCRIGESGIEVHFEGQIINATVVTADGICRWYALLPAKEASTTPYQISARLSSNPSESIVLNDVLFGDVFVCSGQSNMAYALNGSNGERLVHPPVNNSEHEVPDMLNYPFIRLLRLGQQAASIPMLEPLPPVSGGDIPPVIGWSKPCLNDSAKSCRVDFSNMCWFFGRNLQVSLSKKERLDNSSIVENGGAINSAQTSASSAIRPIGLIGTYWGGTADELWSSDDALRKCLDPSKPIPPQYATLWNGMITPLLNTTIKGAIWYQGEADSRHPGGPYDGYNCTFPAMIADWRAKWHASTGGATPKNFPFGFVQLDSVGNDTTYNNPIDPADNQDDLSAAFGFAGLRWAQTASYGYAPNEALPNVFMAISHDTPDKPFPYTGSNGVSDEGFNVHSPFKQPVAARLARSALSLVYDVNVDTTSPQVSHVAKRDNNAIVYLKNCGSAGGLIESSNTQGFEVLVSNSTTTGSGKWKSVPVIHYNNSECSVTVGDVYDPTLVSSKIRYSWYSNPCREKCYDCAVYIRVKPLVEPPLSGMEDILPLGPFVRKLPQI